MNIIDFAIIVLLILGGFIGMKKGFTSQLVDTVGTIAIIIISFLFKGYLSSILYKIMPFFEFYGGDFQYITSFNIILYEVLAFIILFSLLSIILSILKHTTKIFESILNFTIILGIPSKILGAIVGLINNFIFAFVILYLLSLPMFGFSPVAESQVANKILSSTPFLSSICKKSLDVFSEFNILLDKHKEKYTYEEKAELNQQTLQLLVDKKVVSASKVNELISNGKLRYAKPIEE